MHPYREPPGTDFTAAELAWFRKPLGLLLLTLVGCARLEHVAPQPRDEDDKTRAAVFVNSYCDFLGTIEGHAGSGVVISEHHVLTAAHIVECPDLPRVYITLQDGQRHRANVVREDHAQDIAKIEIAHAGRFGLNIAPPVLAPKWDHPTEVTDYLCAYGPRFPVACDVRMTDDVFAAPLKKGWSGAAVYDRAYLVGIVIRSIREYPEKGGDPFPIGTRIAIVSPDWLEGT